MLWALALSLASTPSLESIVQRRLVEPRVRMVALVSIPEKCEGCRDEVARWKALAARHRARGLRLIAVVGRDPMLGCIDPGWKPDETICDSMYDGIAKLWALPERRSTAFLWSWKGELILKRADLAQLEKEVTRQLAATLPRIAIDIRGKRNGGEEAVIRAAIAASNKYEPDDDETRIQELGDATYESIYRRGRRCELGEGLNADAILGVRFFRGTAELTLRSETGCLLMSAEESWQSPGRAIEALLTGLARTIPIPEVEKSNAAGRLATSREQAAKLRDPIGKQLAARIERDLGRTDLDGASFVRAVLLDAFRIDVGATMSEQLHSGPEIQLDLRDPERALRPGDLIFYVSYAYVPKVVLLYLGQGQVAEVADVLGVVIRPLPLELPWFFQSVARRPLTAGP